MRMHVSVPGGFWLRGGVHMPHPFHWLGLHPMMMAVILACTIALILIGLASLVHTGISPQTLNPLARPAM